VIATQNDTYATGTFPLPEPQLDRFLLSIALNLPDAATQSRILLAHANHAIPVLNGGSVLVTPAEILALQTAVAELPVSVAIAEYVTALCQTLRRLAGAEHAVSIRASLAIVQAARAQAFLDESPAVFPDHVQAVFTPVMRHRVLPNDGADPAHIVQAALDQTPVV
jgi:MoxR-like ATPase